MGDKRFLSGNKITKNDICNYILSECNDNNRQSGRQKKYSVASYDSDYKRYMDQPTCPDAIDDEEDIEELCEMQQREWDEQEDYERKLQDIHDRYPDFDAEEAAFMGVDPEEAERQALVDDY